MQPTGDDANTIPDPFLANATRLFKHPQAFPAPIGVFDEDACFGFRTYAKVLTWRLNRVQIKRYGMPQRTYFKLFRVLVSTCQTDYLITHEIAQQDTNAAEQESDVRWLVEQFHREIKQVTGIESCQCRKSRSQRNHVALAALTWLRIKHLAHQAKTTVYQLKQGLLDAYTTRELTAPILVFA